MRMEPASGLHAADMLAAFWEGCPACAHAKDDLGRDEATIPQEGSRGVPDLVFTSPINYEIFCTKGSF